MGVLLLLFTVTVVVKVGLAVCMAGGLVIVDNDDTADVTAGLARPETNAELETPELVDINEGFLIGNIVALLVVVDDDEDEDDEDIDEAIAGTAGFDVGFVSTIGKSMTRSGRFISITSSVRSNSLINKKRKLVKFKFR